MTAAAEPDGLYGRCDSCGDPHLCTPANHGSRRKVRPAFRIELAGFPSEGRATEVRVKLIDQERGTVIGVKRIPFEWLRDVAWGGVAELLIHEGDVS
jgi:hypothetical protein